MSLSLKHVTWYCYYFMIDNVILFLHFALLNVEVGPFNSRELPLLVDKFMMFGIINHLVFLTFFSFVVVQVFISFDFTVFLRHRFCIKNIGQDNETLPSILLEY